MYPAAPQFEQKVHFTQGDLIFFNLDISMNIRDLVVVFKVEVYNILEVLPQPPARLVTGQIG